MSKKEKSKWTFESNVSGEVDIDVDTKYQGNKMFSGRGWYYIKL